MRPTLPEGLYLTRLSLLMLLVDMCEFKCRFPGCPRLNLISVAFPLPPPNDDQRFFAPWWVLSLFPLPCCANRGFRGLSCVVKLVANVRITDGVGIGNMVT